MNNDTRKLTAKMVTEALDMLRKKEYEHKGNVFLLTEAQYTALFARLLAIDMYLSSPWVKTADRLPTEADGVYGAGGDIVVIALTKYAHGYYPELVSIKKLVSPDYPSFLTPKYFPCWMPIPENPGEWKEE